MRNVMKIPDLKTLAKRFKELKRARVKRIVKWVRSRAGNEASYGIEKEELSLTEDLSSLIERELGAGKTSDQCRKLLVDVGIDSELADALVSRAEDTPSFIRDVTATAHIEDQKLIKIAQDVVKNHFVERKRISETYLKEQFGLDARVASAAISILLSFPTWITESLTDIDGLAKAMTEQFGFPAEFTKRYCSLIKEHEQAIDSYCMRMRLRRIENSVDKLLKKLADGTSRVLPETTKSDSSPE